MTSKKFKRKRMDRALRWNDIHDCFHNYGWDIRGLADEFGMSARLVRKILRKKIIIGRIPRPEALKELLPGINALFGMDYAKRETT